MKRLEMSTIALVFSCFIFLGCNNADKAVETTTEKIEQLEAVSEEEVDAVVDKTESSLENVKGTYDKIDESVQEIEKSAKELEQALEEL